MEKKTRVGAGTPLKPANLSHPPFVIFNLAEEPSVIVNFGEPKETTVVFEGVSVAFTICDLPFWAYPVLTHYLHFFI